MRVKKSSRSQEEWTQGWNLAREDRPTPPYTPTHPYIEDDLVLASLSFTPAGNVAYFKNPTVNTRMVWYKAVLSTNVFDDKRAAENLLRRMGVQATAGKIPETFENEIKEGGPLTTTIARSLGIVERHVRHIYRTVIRFETDRPTTLLSSAQPAAKKRRLETELEMIDDIVLGEAINSTPFWKEEKKITECMMGVRI